MEKWKEWGILDKILGNSDRLKYSTSFQSGSGNQMSKGNSERNMKRAVKLANISEKSKCRDVHFL